MKKIYVVGGDYGYTSWINDCEVIDNPEEADIIFFTGGADVDPELYGKERYPRTYSDIDRDYREKDIFDNVREDQICLGVCRGSQFLCVMNGGILVQDCENHAIGYTHEITNGSTIYNITSTHHQMQYPFDLPSKDYDLLYWSGPRSGYYEGDGIDPYKICRYGDPEIVLYHKKGYPKCLAIQGHPEMMRKESPTITMLNNLLNSVCQK